MKRVSILVNCNAGTGADEPDRLDQVRDALVAAGLTPEIVACAPARLTDTARELAESGVDLVIAAGGDGTISAVAQGLAGTDVPLAVLPLGTRNHFAQDIGMPLDLAAAAQAIATGTVRRIDLGEVNGRAFLNNSSIGLYPELVMDRVVEQRLRGRKKTYAMLIAAIRVLKRFPLLRVQIVQARHAVHAKTPFVFVGNNEYSTNALSLGRRERLDAGRLSLYTVRCRGRLHMFWVMMRALLQRLDQVRDFYHSSVDQVWINLHGRRVRVALDGEVVKMQTPLHYRILRGALAIVVPEQVAAAEPVPADVPPLVREVAR